MRRLRTYLSILLIICLSWKADAQTLTHQFTDPCTNQTYFFSVPATGTTVFFLGQSRQFTSADVSNGTFASWINQVYADYRRVAPCGQQQGQINQNLITSQVISNTVQSVVGSIMSQAQSAATSTVSSGSSDAASKNNKDRDKKSNKNENSTSISQTNNSTSNADIGGNSNGTDNTSASSSNSSSGNSRVQDKNSSKKEDKGEEVAATTTMNIDQQNQNDSKNNNSSNNKTKTNSRSNPVVVSSDLTTAQNLDKSFTPILNLSMSQSSMTGMSSWGVTSMIWFNFKQFALSGKYTKISFSKSGKLKWIHNINLTGVYTYGNILGFVGYSGILNAGKWGITGFNTSAAATLITQDKNTFISPSFTAFYTKPFQSGKRLTISPEIYIISTPLIYSTKEKVTTTDRTFSAFLGSGFDYQLTKRFKLNINYKANLSTNPEFPILSFVLIGSKINL